VVYLTAAFVSFQLSANTFQDFFDGYYPGALGMQREVGYVNQRGEFITRWPPGYSLFISPWVVEDVNATITTLQYISGTLAAVWVMLVAHLATCLIPRVSIVVVLGMGIFWPPLWAIGDPMRSEMLFTVLSTFAVYLLVRLYSVPAAARFMPLVLTFFASCTLVGAALTKTTGLALVGAISIAVASGFRSWSLPRRAGVLLCGALVFIAGLLPWLLTYQQHTGHFGFTSNGFESIRHGLQRYPSFVLGSELRKRSANWHSYRDIWIDIRDLATSDPFGALRLAATKFVQPWYTTWSGRFDRYLMMVQLPWFLLFAATSGRTLWRWHQIPGEVILLHGCVAALWLSAILVAPLYRYLAPGFPFVVLIVLWHAGDIILKSGSRAG
jgi:hypothetical protein